MCSRIGPWCLQAKLSVLDALRTQATAGEGPAQKPWVCLPLYPVWGWGAPLPGRALLPPACPRQPEAEFVWGRGEDPSWSLPLSRPFPHFGDQT